jgi:mRNA-degrading endonuclease YafQ of YafQ-DinJ toxin-antitoxin module
MRRIVGFILHRSFEKSYARQELGVKAAFRERRNLLLIDPDHPLLNCHPLQGKWKGYWSMNVNGDVRAVFKTEGFFAIFVEIDTHGRLYR